jgi:hypothetical protein
MFAFFPASNTDVNIIVNNSSVLVKRLIKMKALANTLQLITSELCIQQHYGCGAYL